MENMNDFGLMCICAARYAIGRRTYVSSAIPRFITSNLDKLNENDLRVLRRDIKEEIRRGNYGDENIDKPYWDTFVSKLDEVLGNTNDY